jgi:uncharacterized membrane protein YhaH (DUF805 family)
MPNPIIRGFANIARFSGRDTRAQFWPYAAAATALYLVVGLVVVAPIVLPVIGASQTSAAALLNMAGAFIVGNLLMFVALVAFLAAAVARRLHDSGRRAIWGLLPLPFAAYSGTMFYRLVSQFATAAPDAGLFLSLFVSNLLYIIGLVTLVVLLALRSTAGPNRYGERAYARD